MSWLSPATVTLRPFHASHHSDKEEAVLLGPGEESRKQFGRGREKFCLFFEARVQFSEQTCLAPINSQ